MAGRFSLLNEFCNGSSELIEPFLEFWEQNGEEEYYLFDNKWNGYYNGPLKKQPRIRFTF